MLAMDGTFDNRGRSAVAAGLTTLCPRPLPPSVAGGPVSRAWDVAQGTAGVEDSAVHPASRSPGKPLKIPGNSLYPSVECES